MDREPSARVVDAKPRLHGGFPLKDMFRGGLAAVLLAAGAAAVLPRAPLQSEASAAERDVSETEKILRNIQQAEVPLLLRYLDHDAFPVREKAQEELLRRAMKLVEERGNFPPWMEALLPVLDDKTQKRVLRLHGKVLEDDVSLEVNRRLMMLREEIDWTYTRMLFKGTTCELPEGTRTVHEVLARASRSIDRPVAFYGASVSHGEEKVQTRTGTLWEVIHGIKLSGGRHFTVTASLPSSVDLGVGEIGDTLSASNGVLHASLDPQSGYLHIATEPKAELRSYEVLAARIKNSQENREVDISHMKGRHIPLPYAFRESGAVFEVDVACTLARMRKYAVSDSNDPSTIQTGTHTFLFGGLARNSDALGNYEATLALPQSVANTFGGRITCKGLDAEGLLTPRTSSTYSLNEVRWFFPRKRPRGILIYIPDDGIPDLKRTVTFVFRRP